MSKVFQYQEDNLSYTVTIYEENGAFFADITVNEGAMDVNAIYYGDDDYSGASEALKGSLNMNGAGSTYEGEKVQWDEAVALSKPGLGREGEDKETFLSEGETLKVSLDIDSLDSIDIFGIRATSTTTDSGSIKGVSGDPQEPEEPEEPEEPTYDKVFFGYDFDGNDNPLGGYFILADEPENNEYNIPVLPEGTEPTFENFANYFEQIGGDVTAVESVVFYQNDYDGVPQEAFRVDAPDEGFADTDAMVAAYDDAIATMEDLDAGEELMLALMIEREEADDVSDEEDMDEFEDEAVL
ncbi:hypothetical protein [Oceaniglobus trochenteri]|uniref:hypothetical protein n=1 Tax=Oceaniglobus trochenteri TaxID=2763260 RepID=UPI001CFFBE58|nr:hypothetical protein [Oceaniglobus trochenteri]